MNSCFCLFNAGGKVQLTVYAAVVRLHNALQLMVKKLFYQHLTVNVDASEYFCTAAVARAELTCRNRHGPAALEFLRFNLKARKSEDFFTYRSEEQPEELWTAVRGESCVRLTFHTADRKTLKGEQGESSAQELRQGATDQRLTFSRSS